MRCTCLVVVVVVVVVVVEVAVVVGLAVGVVETAWPFLNRVLCRWWLIYRA